MVPERERTDLLGLEQGFWLGDVEYYRANLARKSIMVFPDPVGVLNRAQILAGIQSASRWVEVAMTDVQVLDLDVGPLILTYKAQARRERQEFTYTVLASSLYVFEEEAWKLAFHQHTPTVGG